MRTGGSKGFVDSQFPPVPASIGPSLCAGKEWVRAKELRIERLFHMGAGDKDQIQPTDINQGSLGDCWLLSSIACLAEFPGAIRQLFTTRKASARGEYKLKLFCTSAKEWVPITLDDHVPTDCQKRATTRPCFVKSDDDELWIVLLEKAFAKAFGSYEGG
jgi:calpain-15